MRYMGLNVFKSALAVHITTSYEVQRTNTTQWPRADPAALAVFDPSTKVCDHNCGPAAGDPRTDKERLYLCDLCGPEGKEKAMEKETAKAAPMPYEAWRISYQSSEQAARAAYGLYLAELDRKAPRVMHMESVCSVHGQTCGAACNLPRVAVARMSDGTLRHQDPIEQPRTMGLPAEIPDSDLLWRCLTHGYTKAAVEAMLSERDKQVLQERATKAWAEIVNEVQQKGGQTLPRDAQPSVFGKDALSAIRALREWVQAVPDDVAASLPAMPGVDGDWLDSVERALSELPDFSHVATRKLQELQERGYQITGYAIEKPVEGAQPSRGFINDGGFVGWWRGDDGCNMSVARTEAHPADPGTCVEVYAYGEPKHLVKTAWLDSAREAGFEVNLFPDGELQIIATDLWDRVGCTSSVLRLMALLASTHQPQYGHVADGGRMLEQPESQQNAPQIIPKPIPMASAPKDGTVVALYSTMHSAPLVASWNNAGCCWVERANGCFECGAGSDYGLSDDVLLGWYPLPPAAPVEVEPVRHLTLDASRVVQSRSEVRPPRMDVVGIKSPEPYGVNKERAGCPHCKGKSGYFVGEIDQLGSWTGVAKYLSCEQCDKPSAQRLLESLKSPACWCGACDQDANHGMRSRMSLCPDCGDKRCPKARHHDSECGKSAGVGHGV